MKKDHRQKKMLLFSMRVSKFEKYELKQIAHITHEMSLKSETIHILFQELSLSYNVPDKALK